MFKEIFCPKCDSDNLKCNATISAVLQIVTHGDGEQEFELYEWDGIKNINWFECRKCDFYFDEDGKGIVEYLETEEDDEEVS